MYKRQTYGLSGLFAAAAALYLTTQTGAGSPTIGRDYILPVSYTHLRAHETVLDLVCRLLLEKKKKTKLSNKTPYTHPTIHNQAYNSRHHNISQIPPNLSL